jgi:hypothetical protein
MSGVPMKKAYEAPAFRELGSLQEMTATLYNKIGPNPDTHSTDPNTVGSLVIYIP